MAETELKLKISSNVEDVKKVQARLDQLTQALKIIELRVREGKVTSEQYSKALSGITAEANKLTVTLKQSYQTQQAFFLSQQHVVNGFGSMSKSLHDITQASNRSQQAFVALAYIIQDLPYGIRGVANNITQLSQVLGTPIWLNVAISAFTSLAVVLSNTRDETKKLSEDLTSFANDISKIYEGLEGLPYQTVLAMKRARLAAAQERFAEEAKKTKREEKYIVGYRDVPSAERGVMRKEPIYDKRYVQEMTREYLDAMRQVAEIEVEITNFITQRQKASTISPISVEKIIKLSSIDDLQKLKESNPLALVGMPDGSVKYAYQITMAEFALSKPVAGVKVSEQVIPPEETIKNFPEEQLREATNAYNSLFFDPVRAGFRALSDEIRQGLFGSLDDLKNKFGNVGAAIIQSLNNVIAKLMETALVSALLSAIFPGSVRFASIFQSILMPGGLVTSKKADGGWIHEPVFGVGRSGKTYLLGESGSEYVMNNRMANNIIGGGSAMQNIKVEVVGKIRSGDIYLSYKHAESLSNLVKL